MSTLGPICDFCGRHEIAWRYPALSFDTMTVMESGNQELAHFNWQSVTDWAACDECSVLIEAEDWSALAKRAVLSSPVLRSLPSDLRKEISPQVYKSARALHQAFKKARTADREPA